MNTKYLEKSIGIFDTMGFATSDFTVFKQPDLDIFEGIVNEFTGVKSDFPLYRFNNKTRCGLKAKMNLPKKNLYITIVPSKQKDPYQGILKWYVSLPKYMGRDNFLLGNYFDLKIALKMFKKDLEEIGIKINVDTVKVYRLDLTKNKKLDLPVLHYNDCLRLIGCSRGSVDEIKDSLYLGNTQYKSILYDKYAEQMNHNGFSKLRESDHNGRNELRFLNTRKITTVLGSAYPKDLLSIYGDLDNVYSGFLSENVFRYDKSQYKSIIDTSQEKSDIKRLMKTCYLQYDRGWLREFKKMMYYFHISNNYSEEFITTAFAEVLDETLDNYNSKKSMKSKFKKDLRVGVFKNKMIIDNLTDKPQNIKLSTMYEELQSKFVA